MTAPALLMSLVIVCSSFGTALEQTADYGNNYVTDAARNSTAVNKSNPIEMGNLGTNNKYRVTKNNVYNELNDEISTNIKKEDVNNNYVIFDELYNENENVVPINMKLNENSDRIKVDTNNKVRQYDFYDNDHNKYLPRKQSSNIPRRRVKRDDDPCLEFTYNKLYNQISHPHKKGNKYYYNSTECVTIIPGSDGTVVQLTFVDVFHIEDHPDCAYDYLEIRDGQYGYSKLLGKFCGEQFPHQIISSGPNVWLKFYSDDTIEYEGFHINIEFIKNPNSHNIPESCNAEMTKNNGVIGTAIIDPDCTSKTQNGDLDYLWTITTSENTKIYLNFTNYELAKPNECEENVVQVFGAVLEYSAILAHYCGSVANSVTTKGGDAKSGKGDEDKGNIMHVRIFASKLAKGSKFSATYTAFRTLDPNKDDKCDENEFDCQDNTCIDMSLKCDPTGIAHCRLKTDEDPDQCKSETENMITKPHILVILVIFSLILSGMSFVFLFKCFKKLYEDHKIIKEHIKQSCEDRLDTLVENRLTLDAKRLQLENEPRASLERENHTNEMFKQQRKHSQRKVSKQSSIESDFIQETQLDLEDEPWRREVESIPEVEDVRIERNGRIRRSDLSKKEESVKSKSLKVSEEHRERKEIRDASVGAPDTKESGCQTRESLFQSGTAPSSDGSGSNGRGFSTFGYSGATIARPSPPAPLTSEITIELLKQVPPHQESVKSQKKSDRRPMSAETTRSAPDVIIVSKPIR